MEEYWPLIVALVLAIAKAINSKTKHWQERTTWWGKMIALLIEVLDLFRVPNVPISKIGKGPNGPLSLLMLVVFLSSCASFKEATSSALDYAYDTGVVAREVGHPLYSKHCADVIKQCKKDGDTYCQPMYDCEESLDRFDKLLKSLQFLVVDTRTSLAIYEEKEPIEDKMVKIMKLISDIRNHLVALGVPL